VAHRAADAYIDTEAVRLTTHQALWRLGNDQPATAEVATAKFWAAWGGQRVVHAAQHLHGGVGVGRDYPLHRRFLQAKELELQLGGSTQQLLALGDCIARDPACQRPGRPTVSAARRGSCSRAASGNQPVENPVEDVGPVRWDLESRPGV